MHYLCRNTVYLLGHLEEEEEEDDCSSQSELLVSAATGTGGAAKESELNEAIEAYHLPTKLPTSPTSVCDIDVITWVDYVPRGQSIETKTQHKHIFLPASHSLEQETAETTLTTTSLTSLQQPDVTANNYNYEHDFFLGYRSSIPDFENEFVPIEGDDEDDDDEEEDDLLGLRFMNMRREIFDKDDPQGFDDPGYDGDVEEKRIFNVHAA